MRRHAALFTGVVTVAALAALGAGIAVIGSPAEVRERRLDSQRVGDLRRIASALDTHVKKREALPPVLEALRTADQPTALKLTDPATAEAYDYAPTGERSYRLCATFSHPSGDDGERDPLRTPEFWRHGAGRHCFAVEVAVGAK